MHFIGKMALSTLLLSISWLHAAETFNVSNASLEAHLLASQKLNVTGEFARYNFPNVESAFDWTFSTANGTVYQLQGKKPTSDDVFGWKQVTVTPDTAQWYMSYLGDWDGDGNSKFDWILVGNGSNAVYKLAGVTDTGNFAYSSKINVAYTVSGDKSSVTFGDSTTPQFSVSYPTSGDVIAKVTQTNGDAEADFYAKNNILEKITGKTDGSTFEIIYANDKVSSYSIDDNKIIYTYNSNGTANFKFYVKNAFVFESNEVSIRSGLSKEAYESLMKEAGGNLLLAATILRDAVINNPLIGINKGICDKTDFRYDADRCIKLFERSLYLISHVNLSEKPALEEVAQSSTNEDSQPNDKNDGINLEELYTLNAEFFNDLYIHFDQCPYDEPEHKYTNLVMKIEEGTLYCHYKNRINSGFTIDPNDVKWGTRISVSLQEGVMTSITQKTETTQFGANLFNNSYSAFSLYENGKNSYSTHIVNSSDLNSDYIYYSYNNGIKDWTARYDKDFKLIRFCQYNEDGKGYAWCDPEF